MNRPPLRLSHDVFGNGAQARNRSPNHRLARIDLEPELRRQSRRIQIRPPLAVNSGACRRDAFGITETTRSRRSFSRLGDEPD
jgi:hypothetical protein